ncbi:hypothetical protein LTR74_006124 [Friedmanniomyces endolithicus]|nr:hypothetical protein LTR74_006124 [Friedmanniomyces endolithicus]
MATVTVYSRNPSKLPQNLSENIQTGVNIVKGTSDDLEAASRALRSGPKALVSFACPHIRWKGTPVPYFYSKLFTLAPGRPIKRVLVCATAFSPAPDDGSPTWLRWFGGGFVWLVSDSAYAEQNGIGRVTTGLPLDLVEWTLLRWAELFNRTEPLT